MRRLFGAGRGVRDAPALASKAVVAAADADDRPQVQRSDAELEAIGLWLERFHADGEWDKEALQAAFQGILAEEPDLLRHSYWDIGDIDLILHGGATKDLAATGSTDEADETPSVTREGDLFVWSRGHRALCGNSRLAESYERLMAGATAQLMAVDPPFGTAVAAISRRHGEWREGSGMTQAETLTFFEQFLAAARPHLADGALVYSFIDQKGMYPLLGAMRAAGLAQKNICTWFKGGGVGGFLMNVAEYLVIAKHGRARHVYHQVDGFNTTVWSVPGYGQGRPDRQEALAAHACTKPQGILMPILLQASDLGDICLDAFLGSGSGMCAAERVRRRCYGIEIEPRFIDTAVRRMQALTGEYPVHEDSGLRFDELAVQRGVALRAAASAGDEV